MQVERAVFGSILEERVEVHKAGWNIATFQCRDVGSTNIEVNKWQRRDVSASSASPSLKAKRGPEFEGGKIVRTRARKVRAATTLILKKRPSFFIFLLFG